MPTTGDRASRTRTRLLAGIILVWGITFAAVGLGTDGVTGLCIGGESPDPIPGYTWAQDHTNDCTWTLYRGNLLTRDHAPDSVYLDRGLTPPETSPMLHDWQIVLILIATGTTAALGLWRERLRERGEEAMVMITASADVG
jgi:hypothetical protein